MKILQVTLAFILFVIFAQSCKSTKNSLSKVEKLSNLLFVAQNDKESKVNKLDETVELDRQEFSLRFYNKPYKPESNEFYSAQIAAFLKKEELDKINLGIQKADLKCFEPGSGMAPNRSGRYESLIFKDNGHHYTIYENSDSKRLNLISESDEILKLEFEINQLYYEGKQIKLKDTDLDKFYIAVLIDRNLNGVIDEGELNKLTILVK
ncbi:hypothetical protein SAMN05661096_01415 [Marivirga sericea]|uniref:Lipoprotein n=1 Tax=Marivirga sericea TaxID=1028 RepID=A0A1X7J7U5_9BACT|nr:hypothetical protein [Marivirga sericea]SMG23690.1 hypothetical protein SAMN05661096_01415 [Marivirga sericea]